MTLRVCTGGVFRTDSVRQIPTDRAQQPPENLSVRNSLSCHTLPASCHEISIRTEGPTGEAVMKNTSLAPPILALLLGAVGCESLTGEHSVFRSRESQTATDAEEHRARFLETRNAEDLQWLLKNSIRSGMSRGEVAQVFGEQGERVRRDFRYTRNGGHYRENDVLYKWGPDNEGRTILLAFRDDKLVNFDPEFFESDFSDIQTVDESAN